VRESETEKWRMAGKTLIRIPETPGIPAVLREIAALCPRHSSTAATRLFSFPSPRPFRPASEPTDRPARVRVRACTRYISRAFREYVLAYTFSFSAPSATPAVPDRSCPIAVDFSRWKGRPVMAGDISAILYGVRRGNITRER
jgi:hypothetical protein